MNKWLQQFEYCKDDTTHLFMDGGKVSIPPEKEKEFVRLYSNELKNKNKVYVVECRPDVFRYIIDIDIIDTEYWSESKIQTFVKIVQSVIYQFYQTDLNVICCSASQKEYKDGIKTGLHLIWPRHFIISEDALTLREAILFKIKTEWTKYFNSPINSWEDIIDDVIYTRNGYRMVGSDKIDPKTRNPENRPYSLIFIMDSLGNLRTDYFNRLNNDYYSLILDTSIRNVPLENHKLTIPFTKIPDWFPTAALRKTKKSGNRSVNKKLIGTIEQEVIQTFMDSELPDVYKNQSIKEIRQYQDGNYLIITNSSFCMNIGRNHRSCGIYFFATPKGLYQKCLCPCNNLKERINGYCKDYTSKCYEFTPEITELLFPQELIDLESKKTKKTKKIVKNLSNNQTKSNYLKNHAQFCDTLLNNF